MDGRIGGEVRRATINVLVFGGFQSPFRPRRDPLMKQHLLLLVILVSLAQCAISSPPPNPSGVTGVWEGTLRVFGQNSCLVFRISVNSDGTLLAVHDAPDYALNNIPVAETILRGDSLSLKIGLYDGVFEGKVEKDVIVGRYGGDSGLWFPLTLRRRSSDPRFLMEHLVPCLGRDGMKNLRYDYVMPEEGEDRWSVADACAEGLDTTKINGLMRSILGGNFANLHSLLLVKDGKLIIDEYFHGFTRDKPHRLSSVSKVITAAAVGIAVGKGLIKDLHGSLVQLLPEYQDILGTGEKSSITLYHLLTMTTGLRWNEHSNSYFDPQNDLGLMKRSPDPLRNLFERPLVYHPGEQYMYNSGNMLVLDAILQKVTHVHPLVLTQNDLFTPMGISNFRWDFTEGFYMVPRDMAKLGLLYLNRGAYNGMQILPTAWVDSAIQRDDRLRPRYFNHWTPMVFFVGGLPFKAYQAGGWGGQSITIFPSLNAIVVMTAANQLEPADYDICIRDFILPAIMTPKYMSTHAGVADRKIRLARNLIWEKHWDTEMGSMKSCARSIGCDVTDSRLYGATGVGFLINIDETAAAKSMAIWNKQRAYELCRNLGFSVESIWSHTSNKDFAETQKHVWDRVRHEIDSGYACYGFHFEDPIRYLVFGYDHLGYYYLGWGAEWGEGPVFWNELGRTEIGLLGMHFVRPVSTDVPFNEVVKEAFRFVLDFSANDKRWVPGDCKAGPDGYARWVSLFESGKEDEYGASYNALEFAEARRDAVEFLEEAKRQLDPSLGRLFDRAVEHYELSAQNLHKLTLLFPLEVPPLQRTTNLKNPQRRLEAIEYLNKARAAEIEGLKVLSEIAARL